MKKEFKIIKSGVLYILILITLLTAGFLIPNKLINRNLKSSITYYKENGIRPLVKNLLCTMEDASADSTELNIIKNNGSDDIIKSVFYTRMYREADNQNFMDMAYKTIMYDTPANYNYNRYWHGYQIFLRPMLIFFNVHIIKIICMAAYTGLLVYFIYACIKNKYTSLAIGISLMNVFHIIPFGFSSLEYIPVFMIMMISSILMLRTGKDDGYTQKIFLISGISTAFFDFWTAETLTFTVPCIVYAYIQNRRACFSSKSAAYGGLHWLLGYCGTFLLKWGVSSIIYKENFFKTAFYKYSLHTVSDNMFPATFSLKYNINVLLFNCTSVRTTFICTVIFLTMTGIFVYLFRKKDSSVKYMLSVCLTGLIPYAVYLIFKGHSREYVFFTYRAQLVVIPILVILISEISFKKSLFRKKTKTVRKNNGKCRV